MIVPTKLLLKEQFAARTIRPRIHVLLPRFLVRPKNLKAQVRWIPSSPPAFAFASGRLDCRMETGPLGSAGSRLAGRKQARAAHPAGIREQAPGRLSRGAQSPRARRHEPALSLSPLRAHRSAHGCARSTAQRRAGPGEGSISRTGDHAARAGDQFRALQPGLRFHGMSGAVGAALFVRAWTRPADGHLQRGSSWNRA